MSKAGQNHGASAGDEQSPAEELFDAPERAVVEDEAEGLDDPEPSVADDPEPSLVNADTADVTDTDTDTDTDADADADTDADEAGASAADDVADDGEVPDDLSGFPAGGQHNFREGETLESLIGGDIDQLAAERDEYLSALRRLQADFSNYRSRARRQQAEILERASEGVLVALLPVLDALDLAEAHASPDSDPGALPQIGMLLRGTLEREGLERIDAVGVPFDPTVHDAVAHEEADDDDAKDTVSEVMRAGYQLKGRVVRPAMVKVKG